MHLVCKEHFLKLLRRDSRSARQSESLPSRLHAVCPSHHVKSVAASRLRRAGRRVPRHPCWPAARPSARPRPCVRAAHRSRLSPNAALAASEALVSGRARRMLQGGGLSARPGLHRFTQRFSRSLGRVRAGAGRDVLARACACTNVCQPHCVRVCVRAHVCQLWELPS